MGFIVATLPFGATWKSLSDFPYLFLTGFSQSELVQLAYLPESELERRTGLPEVPGGFARFRAKGHAAHAIASYLGTRRWGPNVTLAFGYMREYVPWLLYHKEAEPGDIAANYAGVAYALEEAEERE